MKKYLRLFIVLLIGVPLLLFAGSALVLFLAPGVEIFGIRYSASGTSKCEFSENLDPYFSSGFNGDVYIETKNVPIEITFSGSYIYHLEFCQNFIGFTRSKDKKANVQIYCEDGDLHIKVNEIEEFLYSQKSDSFLRFKLQLPISFNNGSRSVDIKSKSSSVKVNGTANLRNFTMDSTGELSIPEETSSLTVSENLKIKTSRLLELKNNVTIGNSCELNSSGNSINITKNVPGDIVATTKGGDLKFVSCQNLTFTSTSGSVKAYGEGGNIVRGNLNAKTKGGAISISKILGEVQSLKTENGSINIGEMGNGTVESIRGKINIIDANNLKVKTNTGNVSVKNIREEIVVEGKNGKVSLGEGGTICNPTVTTKTGKISVYHANGDVSLVSESNDVVFENQSSEKIKLSSGKTLKAKGLKGEVDAYSKKDGTYSFVQISGNVKIKSGSRADNIVIDATCAKISDVDYNLKSTKGTKAKLYSGKTLVEESSSIVSTRNESHFIINVETSYAEIVLNFKEENNVA